MKRTFLDSCVLIAAFHSDKASHDRALEIITDPDRDLILSDLVRLETIPKPLFHQYPQEVKFYEEIFDAASFVTITDASSVERAFDLAKSYGLGPFDACLAEAAIYNNVDEFVTAEKNTKPFFRIQAASTKFVSIAS